MHSCDSTHWREIDSVTRVGAVSGALNCQATERCSNDGEDQGAEEAFMGQKKAINHLVSFGKSRLARATLLFSAYQVKEHGLGRALTRGVRDQVLHLALLLLQELQHLMDQPCMRMPPPPGDTSVQTEGNRRRHAAEAESSECGQVNTRVTLRTRGGGSRDEALLQTLFTLFCAQLGKPSSPPLSPQARTHLLGTLQR